ncbi:PREDICTED: uncharacterized protein LOC104819752 [Tarenaya hassleriana]|uniref:uncharacterized protein LOC104819752 n=1 Tax=Tarenaya hassleriana TaxID=28532 RepID=UPI00053C3C4E|nr:PREDICTED: uncharacterized protein LOC104819752 [Tarenaya hassleriana]
MKVLHFLAPNSPKPAITDLKPQSLSTTTQTQIAYRPNKRSLTISCSRDSNDNGNSSSNGDNGEPKVVARPDQPLEGKEIRFRRGSRRRMREEGVRKTETASSSESEVKKTWEEMTVMEKAMEVYVGEKGLLFWLNKFAYASIFIVIGGWVLFRFVGPSLNLYQLDTPPLAPTNMLKG